MTRSRGIAAALLLVAVVLYRPAVQAQGTIIGTFRWQLQPYCNVVTVTVVQVGGIYNISGTDDQCGASRVSSVVGLAFPNPNGTIGFGLTTVSAPGGVPLHTDATISLATVSGTWQDSAGHSGTFALTPGAGSGGSVRPTPSAGVGLGAITGSQIADATITAGKIAPGVIPAAGIADGAVTTTTLADSAVTTAKVAAGAVTTAKVADGAVTSAKIANGTITSQDLAVGAVTFNCTDTATTDLVIASNGTANVVAPACQAGYTQTSTNCDSSSWLMPFVYLKGGICSARNNDSVDRTLSASRTCCRVQ